MPLLMPVPTDRLPLRAAALAGGLVLFGASAGLLVVAGLGLDPWDVLHQGLSRTVGGSVGLWTNVLGALVLLLWLPLRQRPGIGTVANVLTVGTVIDLTVWLVPTPHAIAARAALLVAGVLLNGVATGLYIGAGFGPGPRDGLMTGLAARGLPLRRARFGIEATVLLVGWLLGGTVGIGTVVFAVAIGPIVHVTVPRLRMGGAAGRRAAERVAVPASR